MSQQLVKKGANGKHENVMPRSWIEAIKDKNTGQTLVEILQGFNMYFLPYNGNTSSTRCLVPTILRKKGLWITYVKYDGNVYTEWYAADEIDDKSWGDSSNWRIGNNTLVGDITISANGNWVINGTETEFKAVGEKGNTPLIRVANNRLQVSYDLGVTYIDVTNNPVYTKFRWLATSGDTQANNVGRIQASTDEGKTWTNMSNDFTNNLHIKKYIGVNESLPTSGIAEGTIYAKGPYYAEDDTLNDNPIYRLWVYAWKDNTLAWQDNGEFQSIAAGVVQETGDSETQVMSQKAVTEKLSELGSKVVNKKSLIESQVIDNKFIDPYGALYDDISNTFIVYAYDLTNVKGVIIGKSPVANSVITSFVYKINDSIITKGEITTIKQSFEFISKGEGTLYVSTWKDLSGIYKPKIYVSEEYIEEIDNELKTHRIEIAGLKDTNEKTINFIPLSHIERHEGWVQPNGIPIYNNESNFFYYYVYDVSNIKGLICGKSNVNNSIICSYSYYVNGEVVSHGDLTSINKGFSLYISEAKTNSFIYVSGAIGYEPIIGTLNELIGFGIIENAKKINQLNSSEDNSTTYWNNKNIAWFGTSIPAGAYPNEPDAVTTGDSYPVICGEILGVRKVYNNSVGGSAVGINEYENSYPVKIRRLGATVKELLDVFNDTWIIDDSNKTFSVGPRILNLTGIPSIVSYNDACWQRWFAISNSYEIRLVSRHLISDEAERINYLRNVVGDIYDIVYSQYPNITNFYDVDMFVFDHCHNDATAIDTYDVNSSDIRTFYGGLNKFINEIYKVYPHKIVITMPYYFNDYKCRALLKWSESKNIPFIDVYNFLPFNSKDNYIITNGFWDKNTSLWKDSGFTWDELSGVPANMYLNQYQAGTTIIDIKNKINPFEVNGTWYYYTSKLNVWIKDSVHPHSDLSGKANEVYAKILAKKLEQFSSGY